MNRHMRDRHADSDRRGRRRTKRRLHFCASLVWILIIVLPVLTISCARAPSPTESDARTASVARLREESGVTEAQAGKLLELLNELGYTGEVMFAYPATDKEDAAYYHIWIGEQTVDVYLNARGEVTSVRQNGVARYENGALPPPDETGGEAGAAADSPDMGSADEPPETEQPSVEPTEPPVEETLSAVRLTDTVEAGDDAWVETYGRPGETYRIEVHYLSGISKARGLAAQTAAEDGYLYWSWTVSRRTTPGEYFIAVVRENDERDRIEVPFSVTEKANEESEGETFS